MLMVPGSCFHSIWNGWLAWQSLAMLKFATSTFSPFLHPGFLSHPLLDFQKYPTRNPSHFTGFLPQKSVDFHSLRYHDELLP